MNDRRHTGVDHDATVVVPKASRQGIIARRGKSTGIRAGDVVRRGAHRRDEIPAGGGARAGGDLRANAAPLAQLDSAPVPAPPRARTLARTMRWRRSTIIGQVLAIIAGVAGLSWVLPQLLS